MKKEKILVKGMSCAACIARVEKATLKVEGVKKAEANLLTNSMQIECEDGVNVEDIFTALQKAGYEGAYSGENGDAQNANKDDKEEALREKKYMLLGSIGFLLCISFISIVYMGHFSFFQEGFFYSLFGGRENALITALSQFILLLPILLLNKSFFVKGSKNLWHGVPNMDTLVALGAGSAVIYGIFVIFRLAWGLGHGDMAVVMRYEGQLYLESAAMILTLINVGRYLEAKAKGHTGKALERLLSLVPERTIVLRNDKEQEIPIKELVKGDIVILRPGSRVPADGVILSGFGSFDESSITGESMPVEKKAGDQVISSAINMNGCIYFQAEKVGEESTINCIIKLVEEAGGSKAPIARIADKIAGVFVPFVISVATVALLFWLYQGASYEFAFSIAISILVISCPCALGLATPVAIMVGTGKGAEGGILIKSGEALESAGKIDAIIFDKTGTLTEGKPSIREIHSFNIEESKLLQILVSLEAGSEHPLAAAVLSKGEELGLVPSKVEDFSAEPGRGIRGTIEGVTYFAGNERFFQENEISTSIAKELLDSYSERGYTPLLVGSEKAILGILGIADKEKESASEAVKALKQMGMEVIMLTGDNQKTALAVGKKLGIERILAQVLPQDKEEAVKKLQAQGKRVAMVGDGINDAPALTRANLGIAIGGAKDIAMESADVVITGNDLFKVVDTVRLSQRVMKNIKENLFWAFLYNTLGIPLAAGVGYGLWGITLSPAIASGAMAMSSFCVVLNALRLKNFKFTSFAGKDIPKVYPENIIREERLEKKMEMVLKIEGMMCGHCSAHVEKALKAMEGVASVVVNLEAKEAVVTLNKELPQEAFQEVIQEAGYELKEIIKK